MIDKSECKVAVSIAEMARMVGLSRQRFHQLIGTAFPFPVYSIATRRPHYTDELQQVCVSVRNRNFGINGKAILFYAKGHRADRPTKPARPIKPRPKEEYPDILAAIRALGLVTVTGDQVTEAVRQVFLNGVDGVDRGKVIRAVFIHLQRRDCGDNVGR